MKIDPSRGACALLLALAGVLAACNSSEAPLDTELAARADAPADDKIQPTIESIQKHVFGPHCISCHAGPNAEQGMRLENPGASYNALVNVRSNEKPVSDRVKPGDADNSYLVNKLEGNQVPGTARMPKDAEPLDAETIAAIRKWIADGAAPPKPAEEKNSVFLPPINLP